jgi:5-methyltetrahydrofolate--homocysteine methyltransferase
MRSYLDDVDFEDIKQRFEAYWNREIVDRPLIYIEAPREKIVKIDIPIPKSMEERWTNIEYVLKKAESYLENTIFLGDAIPWYWPNLGPNSLTAFLGGDLVFLDEETSWVVPFVKHLSEYEPRLDENNRWWRLMNDLLDSLCKLAKGNFLIGIPDLHYGGDSLAAAVGTRELIRALYCQPEEVKRLVKKITDICIQVFDSYYSKISRVQSGCITWIPAYSKGKYFALQDDFTGFLSAKTFVEFFLEEDVVRLSRYLDYSIFHLDGPLALGNLDTLLRIDSLDGIQWVPGAGAEPMSKWVEV